MMTRQGLIGRLPQQLGLAALLAAAAISCSSGASSDPTALSGPYQVSGVRILPSGTGDSRVIKFTVVSATPDRVIFDFDSGDVARSLPARDTAVVAGDYYTVSWNGNSTFNFALSFKSGACIGYDVTGAGDRIQWATCTIQAGR
jgi:hypothetical protein